MQPAYVCNPISAETFVTLDAGTEENFVCILVLPTGAPHLIRWTIVEKDKPGDNWRWDLDLLWGGKADEPPVSARQVIGGHQVSKKTPVARLF
jgi:hypothetical protein